MRPGRVDDFPQLMRLWHGEIARGRQDIVPSEQRLRRVLARFDWELRSRVVESGGEITGSVLVMARPSADGMLSAIDAAGTADVYLDLVRWGVAFSRANGAAFTQITVARGAGAGFESLGLAAVRPWLRIDRGRRRGLATWLVAEMLRRLRAAGARTATLYVDGLNPTRAFEAYRKLGFEVTFEAEVWEATQP